MFTLTAGGVATARVNVLNLSFTTSGTCTANVSLYNSAGTSIAGPEPITVVSGAAGSVIFGPAGSSPTPTAATVPGFYRVVISYPLTATPATPASGSTVIPVGATCSLVSTLELIGPSGTAAYITQFYGVPQISPLVNLLTSRP
jgi:hypothetical protein